MNFMIFICLYLRKSAVTFFSAYLNDKARLFPGGICDS